MAKQLTEEEKIILEQVAILPEEVVIEEEEEEEASPSPISEMNTPSVTLLMEKFNEVNNAELSLESEELIIASSNSLTQSDEGAEGTEIEYEPTPSPSFADNSPNVIEFEEVLFSSEPDLPTEFFGTAGNDTIVADSNNNLIFGMLGDDILTGGAGADEFMPSKDDYFSFFFFDEVTDFNVAEGDKINLSDILDNFGQSGYSSDIADYFEIFDSGVDTFIRVDPTGTGTHDAVMQLTGVTGLPDESTLIANGTVVMA